MNNGIFKNMRKYRRLNRDMEQINSGIYIKRIGKKNDGTQEGK